MSAQRVFCIASLSLLTCALAPTARASAVAECDQPQLSLAEATWSMLEHNPQIDQARSALDAARADQLTAGERPNPTLSLNSTAYNARTGLGSGNLWQKKLDSVLRLDQPIERGGKRELRLQAASAGIEAAEADYRDLVRQMRLATANSYYDLAAAQQRVETVHELAGLQHRTEAASVQRLAAGDIAEADLARIRVETARADSELQQAEADLETARIVLAHLLGCSGEAQFAAKAEWPNPSAEPEISPLTRIASRPDVDAAHARERRSQALQRLAEAQTTRDITVGIQYEHYPDDGQQLLGAGFSVPLFLFNRYDGEIARARADAATAAAGVLQVQSAAQSEIEQARTGLRHAAERARRAAQDLLPPSEKAAAAMDYAYNHGAAGVLDLLDARRTLHAARLEALDAQTAYAKALSAWQSAQNLPQTFTPESAP